MSLIKISKEEAWSLLRAASKSGGYTEKEFMSVNKIYAGENSGFPLYAVNTHCDFTYEIFTVSVSRKLNASAYWEHSDYIPNEMLPIYREAIDLLEEKVRKHLEGAHE